ncbi:Lipopolysaccharide transport periplasmic protein LptA [Pseudodesulfovibrio piezophilus C1TLV30]|uniref:Lipopolysaccharide transport periplasmic protein LptA n=1 Tax=Pseudodesulfovibrio piezophilus (strain DSM 21447 / JCM 15486 / C1TLV30) TaxID=1322246 RepID=M1WNU5_PSEP2|nr:Lipopolysaccharide transport periplasmic protein LptA [Pseudodesulfovibrio piezophilus C1TLV30]
MKRISLSIIFCVCIMVAASSVYADGWGEIREATQNLNVRAKRTAQSKHRVTLLKGQKVKVDFVEGNWGAVFDLNATAHDEKDALGYSHMRFLAPAQMKQENEKDIVVSSIPLPPSGEGEVKADVQAEAPFSPSAFGVTPGRVPIKISSERMIYDESGKMVSFVGNVVAEHGDLTLWAHKLSAYLASSSDKKFSADSIDKIVAEGSVKAQKGRSRGSCGKLIYFVSRQVLRMEDNPQLQDGPNSLTGDVINFYAKENRSEVVGGNGKRVQAVFMTPDSVKVQ